MSLSLNEVLGQGGLCKTDIFEANGTWSKPSWAKWVIITLIGGGGGGASTDGMASGRGGNGGTGAVIVQSFG